MILGIGQERKSRKYSFLPLAVLISIFTLFAQAVPSVASVTSSGASSSCSSSNGVVTNASLSFSIGYSGGETVAKWEYSFDGTTYVVIPGTTTNSSGSLNFTDWYSNNQNNNESIWNMVFKVVLKY